MSIQSITPNLRAKIIAELPAAPPKVAPDVEAKQVATEYSIFLPDAKTVLTEKYGVPKAPPPAGGGNHKLDIAA